MLVVTKRLRLFSPITVTFSKQFGSLWKGLDNGHSSQQDSQLGFWVSYWLKASFSLVTWVSSWKCLLPQDWRKGFTWLMIDPFCHHHFHFQPKLTTSASPTSSRIKRGEKWWLMREGFFLTFCRDFFSITYLSNSYSKHPFFLRV